MNDKGPPRILCSHFTTGSLITDCDYEFPDEFESCQYVRADIADALLIALDMTIAELSDPDQRVVFDRTIETAKAASESAHAALPSK